MDIPKRMKAAVLYGPDDLRIEERDVPLPGPGEVLVKVRACAICGTDPKILSKGWPSQPPYGEYIPGHEYTGEVVAVGETVDEYKVGDRIAVETHKGCGRCVNCLRGMYTICLNYGNKEKGHRHYGFTANGGYAEYVVNHINVLHRLPDNVSFEEGTIATTGGTVLYGLETIGGLKGGETVVIMGPGAIGLMAVQFAKAFGAEKVILTGTRESRLEVGRSLGADVICNVKKENVVEKILDLTGGKGADVVIECSGSMEAAEKTTDVVKRGGIILLLGIYKDRVRLDLNKVVLGNVAVYGVRGEGFRATGRVLSLLGQKKITGKPLITHTFPLTEIKEAFKTFVGRIGGAIKVVVIP
ncbi:alcohol dehydrogenase catalytic domain-containing protein [Candidatus Aerophobetes bacterium]|nr:alcohol dehydrogenase catalytic domain-containing protein [Candidatus Aerophobetes bacterium]